MLLCAQLPFVSWANSLHGIFMHSISTTWSHHLVLNLGFPKLVSPIKNNFFCLWAVIPNTFPATNIWLLSSSLRSAPHLPHFYILNAGKKMAYFSHLLSPPFRSNDSLSPLWYVNTIPLHLCTGMKEECSLAGSTCWCAMWPKQILHTPWNGPLARNKESRHSLALLWLRNVAQCTWGHGS